MHCDYTLYHVVEKSATAESIVLLSLNLAIHRAIVNRCADHNLEISIDYRAWINLVLILITVFWPRYFGLRVKLPSVYHKWRLYGSYQS